MKRRRKLLWCWIKHAVVGDVRHYWRLLRWWWKGTDYHKPFDTRSMDYNAERAIIECEAWLERQKA